LQAHGVWLYGQENEGIVLYSNVLTSYVECLASLRETGADRVVELILSWMRREKMPLRCVRPDGKTIRNARQCLVDNGWKKHATKLDGIEI
jgi:hypothetical protein